MRVGYVVSRFPQLSETFIVREMTAVAELGVDVQLYPLIRQDEAVVHPEARRWVQRARYVPHATGPVLLSNVRAALRSPYTYASVWWAVLVAHLREPRMLVRALVLLPACVHLSRTARCDRLAHLHAHFATFPLLAAWVTHRLTGLPYSVTVHAHDLFVSTGMLAVKLADASFIVSISEFNRSYLAEHVDPLLLRRTEVVRCGVVAERYGAGAVRSRGELFEVVSIGSLQEYKGQRHLVEACRLLRGAEVPFRCRIVGEGVERGKLERLIAAHSLASHVELLGALDEDGVRRVLASADCYVQPSVVAANGQMEGIPVAIMEAMASGLPVVASDLSGIPELVRPGETGWLVPPAQPTALAAAVEQVHRDPETARAVAERGRDLVRSEYDLHANARRLADLLRSGRAAA